MYLYLKCHPIEEVLKCSQHWQKALLVSFTNSFQRDFCDSFQSKSGPKGPEWPNLSIFLLLQHFSKDWLIRLFLIFYMKLRDHKYSKLMKLKTWENPCLLKSRPRRPKMAQVVCLSVTTALFSGLAH